MLLFCVTMLQLIICVILEGNDDVFEEQHQAAVEAGQVIGDLIFHGTEPAGEEEG